MLETVKLALFGLIGSKKVQTAIITALAVLAIKYLHVEQELADSMSAGVFLIGMTLIGAQGLTDLGKGDAGQPLTLKEAIAKSFKGLFASKKFFTAIAAGLIFVLSKYLHIDQSVAAPIANTILSLGVVLIGAQGLTDLGKEKVVEATVVNTIPEDAVPVESAPVEAESKG